MGIRIVGKGTVSHWTGSVWAVHDGLNTVFIRAEDFICCQAEIGLAGILTYEINPSGSTLSLVNCFRRSDDPAIPPGDG